MNFGKKCRIRKRSGVVFLAGMMIAGFFAVLPLQAAEEEGETPAEGAESLVEEEESLVKEEEPLAIQIDVQPEDTTVDVGGDVLFTAAASVTGGVDAVLQYEWQESADGSNYYTIGSGSSYWLSNVQAEQNGHYFHCLVTCDKLDLEPKTSNAALLAVRIPNYTVTVENGQAVPVSAAPGSTVWITADTPSDQEQFKEWVVKEGDVALASPTSERTSFTMPNRNVKVTAAYQAKEEPPRIISEPQDVQVEAGDYASFNVSASGQELAYQWLVDEGDGSGFRKVEGAVSELYRVMVFDGLMNGYEYKCEVSNKAGSVRTRSARLAIFYRIVGGARSNWVKSSGSGLVFQGNGAYDKFSGVSVDGSRITAGEYNKGGSQTPFTEVTLLRSYLETLPEGDHEIEIVWSDGSAKTSFCIAPPATNLPTGTSGLGTSGTGTTGSSRAAGTTAAAEDRAAGAPGVTGTDKTSDASTDLDQGETNFRQISGNALEGSISENSVKPSSGRAADVFPDPGLPVGVPEEDMTVISGGRRTENRPSDFDKSPVQLATMSETVDQYAGTICMAVILVSAAGIASGMITYRLHGMEGQKK